MAEKRRFLDVWIVETNTVYREVPFTVVADWIQQCRLLTDDMLRWSGQRDWFKVGSMPVFADYVPRPEVHRAEDQAEALEQVQFDFAWKRPRDEEDDDVDMIPLIDVSLVLLIFFILTSTAVAVASNIETPQATFAQVRATAGMIWIGIDKGADDAPVYSLGVGDADAEAGDRDLTERQVLERLDARLAEGGRPEVNVKAHRDLPAGLVRRLTVELERRRLQIGNKYTSVREKGGV